MTAEDHAKILQANGEAVPFQGFTLKKTGRVFSASLVLAEKTSEKNGKIASWKEAKVDFREA